MDIALQVDQSVHDNLKSQELSLQFINEDEIQIIGKPKMQLFGKLLLTILGAAIVSFSMIFTQGSDTRSIIIMMVGSLIGLSLIVIPYYNFYSKKQFSVWISRIQRKIIITNLRKQESIPFTDVSDLVVKSFKMDDYVSDETADSNSFCSKFYLTLNNNKEITLFTFSSRDKKSLISFSEAYGNFLSEFMSINLKKTGEF